jgi:acetate kinase
MAPGQVRALLRQPSKGRGGSTLAGALDPLVASNEPRAPVAVELLLYGICRELESLTAALSGLDAIVFIAGACPHAAALSAGICRLASGLGVDLDPAANRAGGPRLTRAGSRVTAWVIPADKPLLVARHTLAVVG